MVNVKAIIKLFLLLIFTTKPTLSSNGSSQELSLFNDTFYCNYIDHVLDRVYEAHMDVICNDVARMINNIEDEDRKKYVLRYKDIAIAEMHRSGIPASIKIAQGILESRAGKSDMVINSNNHFSIKIGRNNKWKGEVVRYKDDKYINGVLVHSTFRAYKTPKTSFEAHSNFLLKHNRYKFLFDLRLSDYVAWSHGLKKAGYATDPNYAYKLIDIIETLGLKKLDKL